MPLNAFNNIPCRLPFHQLYHRLRESRSFSTSTILRSFGESAGSFKQPIHRISSLDPSAIQPSDILDLSGCINKTIQLGDQPHELGYSKKSNVIPFPFPKGTCGYLYFRRSTDISPGRGSLRFSLSPDGRLESIGNVKADLLAPRGNFWSVELVRLAFYPRFRPIINQLVRDGLVREANLSPLVRTPSRYLPRVQSHLFSLGQIFVRTVTWGVDHWAHIWPTCPDRISYATISFRCVWKRQFAKDGYRHAYIRVDRASSSDDSPQFYSEVIGTLNPLTGILDPPLNFRRSRVEGDIAALEQIPRDGALLDHMQAERQVFEEWIRNHPPAVHRYGAPGSGS